jgi:signal transduction histidine kinase
LIADWRLQGLFCLRTAIYWVICQLAMLGTILAFLTLQGFEQASGAEQVTPWSFLVPALVVSIAILPIALLDQLLFTNRIVGPLHRFRKHLARMAAGNEVADLNFRQGDRLRDLSQNINILRSRLADDVHPAFEVESRELFQTRSVKPVKGMEPTTVCN